MRRSSPGSVIAGTDRPAGSSSRGTALITVSGVTRRPWVMEIELGTTIGEIAAAAGTTAPRSRPWCWVATSGPGPGSATPGVCRLIPMSWRSNGLTFGCGIVGLLPTELCGVSATAEIMAFMATESAGQCGPCVFGLRAIGDATHRVANGGAGRGELGDIERWVSQIPGRGACRHPDGAMQLMASALEVFGDEFIHHARTGRCPSPGHGARRA